ncbi:MAG: hypothetical protein ACLT1W_12740 [Alistipes onderdonkii]
MGYVTDKFHRLNGQFSPVARHGPTAALAPPASEFMGITTVAILLVYGGSLVLGGDLPPADSSPIWAFSRRSPARCARSPTPSPTSTKASPPESRPRPARRKAGRDAPDAVPMEGLHEGIEFRDVRFSYENRR